MENEILECNKLIAEFMECFYSETFEGLLPNHWVNKNGEPLTSYLDTELKYHTSWDWLMPVVDKIEKYGIIEISYALVSTCRICVIGGKTENAFNIINDNNGALNPIIAVYSSVVEFIKWYNTTSPNPSSSHQH